MKTIALCFSTPHLEDRFKPEYGKRYPGAGWMKYLHENSCSGKFALDNLNPKDVIVVQEENNEHGQDLVKLGADPRVLMCLESPIFASNFYDNIPNNFKHRLLFNGGTEHLYFPSFDNEDIKEPVPWNERKFLCMVTANKHYGALGDQFKDSPSLNKAMETQLHDYRYKAIEYFTFTQLCGGNMFSSGFDLYGRGWPEYLGKECADKLATIRNYKFCLCFENGSYPGYITEKIIDCLVAGVIPVYMGAPDIKEYIPYNLFVHAKDFASFGEMHNALRSFNQKDGERMIELGRWWIESARAWPYNNRVFAKRILDLCA